MRLWPLAILDQLPRQQLLGQHRECCALRGKGWGRKHSTVDYVFEYPHWWLYVYHYEVMREMIQRGYSVEAEWFNALYRGKTLGIDETLRTEPIRNILLDSIYPEHNDAYLCECKANLARKGIVIDIKKVA